MVTAAGFEKVQLCFALKQCKCVNLNSVPKYNQSYSDCLRVQLLSCLTLLTLKPHVWINTVNHLFLFEGHL